MPREFALQEGQHAVEALLGKDLVAGTQTVRGRGALNADLAQLQHALALERIHIAVQQIQSFLVGRERVVRNIQGDICLVDHKVESDLCRVCFHSRMRV